MSQKYSVQVTEGEMDEDDEETTGEGLLEQSQDNSKSIQETSSFKLYRLNIYTV